MKDVVYSFAGKTISAIAQMIMLGKLAATMPAERIATLLAIYSLAFVIASLGDLGLGTLVARERAYGDPAKADSAIRFADRLALFIAFLGPLLLILASTQRPGLLVCAPLLVWAPVERATETRMLRQVADHKLFGVALITGGRRLLALALFLTLSVAIAPDWGFSVALASSALLAQLVTARMVRLQASLPIYAFRNLLRESAPFAMTSVSGQLRNLDVPIVAGTIGGTSAAAYGLGARFASPFMLVFSSMTSIVLVRARHFERRHTILLLGALLGGSLTAMLTVALLARTAYSILSNHIPWLTLHGMYLMCIVICSYLFAGSGIILGSMCVAYQLENTLVRVNIAIIAGSLTSMFIVGIYSGSAIAVAITSLLWYVSQAIALTMIVASHRPEHPRA